jgi:hypothetical protein
LDLRQSGGSVAGYGRGRPPLNPVFLLPGGLGIVVNR